MGRDRKDTWGQHLQDTMQSGQACCGCRRPVGSTAMFAPDGYGTPQLPHTQAAAAALGHGAWCRGMGHRVTVGAGQKAKGLQTREEGNWEKRDVKLLGINGSSWRPARKGIQADAQAERSWSMKDSLGRQELQKK